MISMIFFLLVFWKVGIRLSTIEVSRITFVVMAGGIQCW